MLEIKKELEIKNLKTITYDNEEINNIITLSFPPQKIYIGNTYFQGDEIIGEEEENNYLFDNSFSNEKDDSSVNLECNELQLLEIQTFDKRQETTKNDYILDTNHFPFKKNRNNLINYFYSKDKNNHPQKDFKNLNTINCNSSNASSDSNNNLKIISHSNIRCDSLLIKFKSIVGKWFINSLNTKLKNILKRKIKFFSFNYKKFTIVVSYLKNKIWLDEKIKNLLILGDEPNQAKNIKAINSIYKRKIEELDEIKNLLESTYRDIIEKFYLSEEFISFKNDKKVKELDKNFIKIMEISLLEANGFIKFLEFRKGNVRKK